MWRWWRRQITPAVAGVAAGFVVAIFVALGARLLDVGASDLNVAGLFSTDEQLAGQLLQAMLRDGNLGLSHFFSYGPLDLYAARALLWPYGLLRPVDGQAVLVALRLVSLLAGGGCLIVTYHLGRRLWTRRVALLAVLLLALSPTLLAWSTTAHPDTLQLFLILLDLLVVVELCVCPSPRRLLIASSLAALACATKYEGALLLPVIWLAACVGRGGVGPIRPGRSVSRHDDASALDSVPRARAWLGDVALSLIIFVVVFLAVDPSVLGEPRRFISQARMESELAHNGHLFAAAASPSGWLRLLGGADFLGPLGLALGLAGLAAWTLYDMRVLPNPPAHFAESDRRKDQSTEGGEELSRLGEPFSREQAEGRQSEGRPAQSSVLSPQSSARLPLAAWTLGSLLLLLIWVADRQPRYALPVLPGLALYAAASLVWLAERLPARRLALAAILLAVLAPLGVRLANYEHAQARRMGNPSIAARLDAGRWLAQEFGSATPILYDAYAYLPPSFSRTQETFGLTSAQVAAFRPLIIVTDADIRDRFRDPMEAQAYHDGAAAYRQIAATYGALENGTLPCYAFLRDFGSIRIYAWLGGVC